MPETLALKYRPRAFEDLVGQPAVHIFLKQMVKTHSVPTALLFDGPRGTGKTTTARILAAALNCETDTAPCGNCPSCKETFDGISLDVVEIDAASNGGVADIRALRQQVHYRQTGAHRIVILDEAHMISTEGFNALLKTLEEPPPNTVFLLLTTERSKIPDTVASRCMPFTFKRLTVADIADRLAYIADHEQHCVEFDLLTLIADRADGAMRDAIMVLDQVTRVGLTTADQYRRLTGHVDHAPAILARIAEGDLPGAFAKLDQALTRVANAAQIATEAISTLRDVLVLRSGGEINKTGTALAARQNLALALSTPAVVGSLKILWQLATLRTDDTRANLELAVVMLAEVIKPAAPAPQPRMTLDDMGNHS
jgi:DNA polymerase-3 subunit gamma/tau